jgi:hypothetical protein
MRYIINDHVVLLRAPEGPLAPYIASFSNWTSEQGYALCSLRQRIPSICFDTRWPRICCRLVWTAPSSPCGSVMNRWRPRRSNWKQPSP